MVSIGDTVPVMADNEYEWTDADLAQLAELTEDNDALPEDALKALLSVRLSVFTDDTTSPARQELDLRKRALDQGFRVVGVASDLGVSATKVPPWKRKSLGHWLNERAPEFDALMFWKLDRFIRNLSDLAVMIRWADEFQKNLVSLNDPIDLSTTMGRIIVTFIGGVAEIEAANTKTRVESLWAYAKQQSDWLVGKPPYGYKGALVEGDDGKSRRVLKIDEHEAGVLRDARAMVIEGQSTSQIIRALKADDRVGQGMSVATFNRRLRNPGVLGVRVEEQKEKGYRRSTPVLDKAGQPIRIADPIFTTEEWDTLQAALDLRARKQPHRNPAGATRFRGVLKCSDCGSNMTVQQFTKAETLYAYLRCQECKAGGMGAPNPQHVYDRLVEDVLSVIGDFPVETREYARGEEIRKQAKELKDRIAYYMKGLEPGGRLTKTAFAEEQAGQALDAAIAELDAIDPSTMEDRWIYVNHGKTFREHWEEGGMEQMADDLLRAGITCVVTRTKVPRQRAPRVELRLRIPEDVRKRLIVRRDEFENPL